MRNFRSLFVILVVILMLLQPGGAQRASAGTFTDCASVTQIPAAECSALLALYNDTGGDYWMYHTNWQVTDTPGDWWGVTVTGGHVTDIILSNDSLNGTIPPELGSLTNLQGLDLSYYHHLPYGPYNNLSGSIPTQLGNLTNLVFLDLSGNQLSGSIPLSFTALTQLIYLNVTSTLLCEPQDAVFQIWKAAGRGLFSPGLCYSISGQVMQGSNPLAGVTISGEIVGSTTSAGDGTYTLVDLPPNDNFHKLPPSSYTLTPSLSGYAFVPFSRSVTITNADLHAQDFHVATNFSFLPLVLRH